MAIRTKNQDILSSVAQKRVQPMPVARSLVPPASLTNQIRNGVLTYEDPASPWNSHLTGLLVVGLANVAIAPPTSLHPFVSTPPGASLNGTNRPADIWQYFLLHGWIVNEIKGVVKGVIVTRSCFNQNKTNQPMRQFTSKSKPQTCKKCGAINLHWKRKKDKWSLVTNRNKLHKCPNADLTITKTTTWRSRTRQT